MNTLLIILAIMVILVGIAGCILPVLPGIPLIFAAVLLYGWYDGFVHIGSHYLLIIGVLTLLSLVSDYILIAQSNKLFGSSKASAIGAMAGTILGIFIFPPLGIILFGFLGAFLVELFLFQELEKAFKAALGAIIAFFSGTVLKVILGIAILITFVIKVV